MDEATLKAIFDATFTYIESKTGNRILVFALKEANGILDAHAADLLALLQGKGLVK